MEKEYIKKMFAEYHEISNLSNGKIINIEAKDYGRLKSTLNILEMGGYIRDLEVDCGHIYAVDESFEYFEANMRAELGEPTIRIIELINMIPEIKNQLTPSYAGIKTIVNDKKFISWKNMILYEIKKLKQDDFIAEIVVAFNAFGGVHDERAFDDLSSKLVILKNNIDQYIVEDIPKTKDLSLTNNKKIFIVHGHDDKLKYEMSNWLRSLDLDPIILHLTANMGIKTIIDKIKENSDVGCAIVLMTADDLGKAKEEENLKPRARQNVVFEAGYFLGKLGEEHVILLYDHGLEAPGDLSGCVYIEADPYGGWKEQVRTEFKAMGIEYAK